jgi:hypothetical protein
MVCSIEYEKKNQNILQKLFSLLKRKTRKKLL